MTLGLVQRLKNGVFILESKMVGLKQNKISNKSASADAVWELCCTSAINNKQIHVCNCLQMLCRIVVLECIRRFPGKRPSYFSLLFSK